MFTQPDDLDEASLSEALRTGWGFSSESLTYRPVGFGSHHWLATDATGARLFVTVDDLRAKRRTADGTTDQAYARLTGALRTALSLRRDSGLDFVAAPIPAADGRVLERLSDRYSVVVHAFLGGRDATDDDVPAILDCLVRLHRADAPAVLVDDFLLPDRDRLTELIGRTGAPWSSGPYAERARALLTTHAAGVEVLLTEYDRLVVRAAAQPERMVVTHGEPDPGNTMVTPDGLMLVDWESALLAPPERDVWNLAEQGEWVIDGYQAASGVGIDREALALYRLWYDLAEIGGYLSLFHAPHRETEDAAESWTNLEYFLRPVERWPHLFG
jgi:spectinomycin phosphotransferase